MATIHVDVTRADLARMTIGLSIRHRSTYITWLVLAMIVIALVIVWKGLPQNLSSWVDLLLSASIGATAGILVSFLFCLTSILFMTSKSVGVLGRHTYEVRDDGLLETTVANETLIKWGGAQDLRRTRHYLMIGVTTMLYHVIPTRSFSNEIACENFWHAIQRLRASDV